MSTLPPYEPDLERPRKRLAYYIVIALMIAAMIAGAWWIWGRGEVAQPPGAEAQKTAAGKAGKGGGRRGGPGGFDPTRAQPVQAVAARRADLNIVQTALGTATALRTVIVKPRVDGQLQNVLFTEGQIVKQGDVLAQIDPVPFQVSLAQAEGTVARDAAQLNNARLDLERYRTLLQQDSIAKQQVDQQAALVRQLEGTIRVGQAQVDNAKLQLSYTRISAPVSGRLGLRQVDPGNMVRSSDANGIAVITQVDPMGVVFTIPQDTLPRVLARLNAGEKPAVEAWDREQKNLLAQGRLITTDNQIDVATGTVRLKAEFPNREGKLFPNQFVNVRMVVDVRKDVLAVPAAAIQRGTQGTIVYVVKDDNTVSIRPVVMGPTEGQLTAIESGLEPGERVITDGVDRIREGARVEVVTPRTGPPQRPTPQPAPKAEGPPKREAAKVTPQDAPSPQPSPKGEGELRKKLEGMSPEERREFFRKRLESMTPEQREEFMKRRRERGGGPPE